MPPLLVNLIADYEQNANLPPIWKCCPCCFSEQASFKQHDCRIRELRYVVTFWVKTFLLTLFRWKCSVCKETFTVYPRFLLPYKRFITPSMLSLCRDYLSVGEATYRDIAHPGKSQYAYENNGSQEFSHVTIWNWFKGLLPFAKNAHKTILLLFRVVPDSSIHREVIPVNSRKYQSEERKICLEQVEFVIRVAGELGKSRIYVSNFPTTLN
ncbi:MAG: DUF6431 domain-containing protein [Gammaproteobacteria bacterium]|nr:DUF6431 domain-containing protein [Gammaproteobacteria bacterium]